MNDYDEEIEELPLYESNKERAELEELANLYAIILATEHLERAYSHNTISRDDYTEQCRGLLAQFRLAKLALPSGMTTENFMELYQMNCPRATERLLIMGKPEPIKGSDDKASHAVTVAETTQHFITAMDAIKIEQRYMDDLQPLLSDLMDALTQLPDTPNDFEPNRKVDFWLRRLNKMRAVDELSEDDARQLGHDLDAAFTEFKQYLKKRSS